MTTVNTIEDIIRAMRERPEVRDAIRREVLTEELLSLPEKLDRLTQRVDELTVRLDTLTQHVGDLTVRLDTLTQRVDDLTVRLDTLTQRVDDLTVRLDTLTQRVDDLTVRLDTLTQRVDDLTAQVAEVVKVQKEHSDKLGILIGDRLERRMATILPPVLSERLGLRRTQVIYHPTLLPSSDSGFATSVEEAADRGIITDEQELRLKVTDLIMRARRKSDGAGVWVAAEASGTIDETDVSRAAESAAVLGTVFGEDAAAVVVGHRIRFEDRERAETQGVMVMIEDEA